MAVLSDEEIERIYAMLKKYHQKYLKQHGVVLPNLRRGDSYTKDALVLVYLARDYPKTRSVSKSDLTDFVRRFYPKTSDVQQARHLAMQKGWYIASGTRGNTVKGVRPGEYKLVSLKEPYPAFRGHRKRGVTAADFEEVKRKYDYRCATCGSKEDGPIFNYPRVKTKLTAAHMNPGERLHKGNIIPQCQMCNRAYRNWWVFDKRGRVVAVANAKVIERSDEQVQREIYEILRKKFGEGT